MKVSKQSMKKLGFKSHGKGWQHEVFPDLRFGELPEWHKIVYNSSMNGNRHGREQTQQEIKEALGIYTF